MTILSADNAATLYTLLARSFSGPTPATMAAITMLLGELPLEMLDAPAGGQPLLPVASLSWAMTQARLPQLQTEYARLFGERGLVCPYSRAYRTDILPEELDRQAGRFYEAWQITPPAGQLTHVETELEFLGQLRRRQADTPTAAAAVAEFLFQHALVWLLNFAGRVVVVAQYQFYRSAAQLLSAFLQVEAVTSFRTPVKDLG